MIVAMHELEPARSADGPPAWLHPEAFRPGSAFARVFRHLEEHLDEPLSLESAARIAGLNHTYFCTVFHRRVGIRFREWVNRFRVTRAARLLLGTELPITEIARRVGFRSLRTFERAFGRLFRCTAREYRRLYGRSARKADGLWWS